MAPALRSDFSEKLQKRFSRRYSQVYGPAIDGALSAGIKLAQLNDRRGLNWLAEELEGVVTATRRAAAGIHQANGEKPTLTK